MHARLPDHLPTDVLVPLTPALQRLLGGSVSLSTYLHVCNAVVAASRVAEDFVAPMGQPVTLEALHFQP